MNNPSRKPIKLVAAFGILTISLLSACTPGTPTTACHATGDPAIPYEAITITSANLTEHLGHPNDIYPVPLGGCPTSVVDINNGKITICHATSSETNPYTTITVSVEGLNGHADHEGDIIPAPAGGCPTNPLVSVDGKITICHATGSEKNPYVEITVSVNGLNGHDKHELDIIPMAAGGCPTVRK
jgi:hypothetical protein